MNERRQEAAETATRTSDQRRAVRITFPSRNGPMLEQDTWNDQIGVLLEKIQTAVGRARGETPSLSIRVKGTLLQTGDTQPLQAMRNTPFRTAVTDGLQHWIVSAAAQGNTSGTWQLVDFRMEGAAGITDILTLELKVSWMGGDTTLERAAKSMQTKPRKLEITSKGRIGVPDARETNPETAVELAKPRRGRPPVRRPVIDLEAVLRADADLADHYTATQRRFQTLLDGLAGGAGKTPEDNVAIARGVVELAAKTGTRLTHDGKIISFRWDRGVFVGMLSHTGEKLLSSAGFPVLKVIPREITPAPLPDTETTVDAINGSSQRRRSTGL